MNSAILNIGLFKAGWLAAVFSAAASMPIAGTAAIAAIVTAHLVRTEDIESELRLLMVAAAVGFAWESLLAGTGLVEYGAGAGYAGVAPYWIVALWVLFATTLNVGFRWLQERLLVASLVGAIGGPLSFLAGARSGAVSFPDATVTLAVIGIGWAVLLPMLVLFAARGSRRTPAEARVRRPGSGK
jgi:hypothetical protein